MVHDEHGYWLAAAGLAALRREPSLAGRHRCEVVVVGGGYTGMWTAWFLADRIGAERVAVVEAGTCGTGPSGRNGGFCQGFGEELETLAYLFGVEAAGELVRASNADALGIGDWAKRNGVDAAFRQSGCIEVSCASAQDTDWKGLLELAGSLGLGQEFERLDREQVAQRCRSPVFRDGLLARSVATVDPGRLSLGLRRRLIERGVRLFEGTRARSFELRDQGVRLSCDGGSIDAGSCVIAAGVESAAWPGLRRELTMTSSHLVITEPIPEFLESVGWTGGEAIVDRRVLVHYFRTTDDGRIAFGWGGGRVARGVRPGRKESVDARLAAKVSADLERFFPDLRGVRLSHAWGGPIDASPRHLPGVRQLADGRLHAAFGFTGNGVGPSRLCGRLMAILALDPTADPGPLRPLVVNSPQRVPPEPARWIGGSAIMKALDVVERAGEAGSGAGPLARALAGIPDRLGYRIGR